jgi:hypothetical protein
VVAEICEEYIPEINATQRVRVVYPVVNRVTNITKGVYLDADDATKSANVSWNGEHFVIQKINQRYEGKVYINNGIVSASSNPTLTYYAATIQASMIDAGLQNYAQAKFGGHFYVRGSSYHARQTTSPRISQVGLKDFGEILKYYGLWEDLPYSMDPNIILDGGGLAGIDIIPRSLAAYDFFDSNIGLAISFYYQSIETFSGEYDDSGVDGGVDVTNKYWLVRTPNSELY